MQRLPLFQFAASRGPRVSVQCIAVDIRCVLAVFKEGEGNVCRRLADARYMQQTRQLYTEVL